MTTPQFRLRQRGSTPARVPFAPMAPVLQRISDRAKDLLAQEFRGVTAGGTVQPGLYRLEKTGHSLERRGRCGARISRVL